MTTTYTIHISDFIYKNIATPFTFYALADLKKFLTYIPAELIPPTMGSGASIHGKTLKTPQVKSHPALSDTVLVQIDCLSRNHKFINRHYLRVPATGDIIQTTKDMMNLCESFTDDIQTAKITRVTDPNSMKAFSIPNDRATG